MKGQISKMYDLKIELEINRKIQPQSELVAKIAVSIFIILDIIF